jgi:hypothetical protein
MSETSRQKTFKQICTCQNCGNEAEMIVTCSLEPVEEASEARVAPHGEPQSQKNQVPGQATCTHCGNEAEILVDLG